MRHRTRTCAGFSPYMASGLLLKTYTCRTSRNRDP
jgi:hypothetical protein